jgi:hypothetical protein
MWTHLLHAAGVYVSNTFGGTRRADGGRGRGKGGRGEGGKGEGGYLMMTLALFSAVTACIELSEILVSFIFKFPPSSICEHTYTHTHTHKPLLLDVHLNRRGLTCVRGRGRMQYSCHQLGARCLNIHTNTPCDVPHNFAMRYLAIRRRVSHAITCIYCTTSVCAHWPASASQHLKPPRHAWSAHVACGMKRWRGHPGRAGQGRALRGTHHTCGGVHQGSPAPYKLAPIGSQQPAISNQEPAHAPVYQGVLNQGLRARPTHLHPQPHFSECKQQ